MKFTGKIVIAAFALVAVPSASAAKWDCWKGFQCAGALPQAPSSGYPYEALLVANGCKCATDNCVGEYDQMPCFQAISPEACFEKGGNSASLWGDMKSDGPKGPQNSDMTKENDPCFMNKYDCWTDCHCKVIPTDEMFFNAMGGGPDACFALDQSITSTCIWGHCNEDYATDVCPEGHAGWDGSKPTCNTDTVPMTVPKDPCKSNSDCGKTWGDPHFEMWSGEVYDYHGECDLVFLDAPALDMTIQIRTTIREDYSFISSAVLRIKDQMIEVGGYGSVIINGVYITDDGVFSGATVGGFPIKVQKSNKKTHTYRIALNDSNWIELKSFKDLVGVKFNLPDEGVQGSRGLMGSVETGEKLGRDGKTVFADVNEFGQEWQVRPGEDPVLFQAPSDHPGEKCRLPNKTTTAQARRLGESVARSDAEQACAHMTLNKEACIRDVMATGDKEIADAFL